MTIVRVAHARKVLLCVQGMRRYAERYNIDFKKFVKEGIDADELLTKTNHDGFAVLAVEQAKLEERQNNG